MCKFHWYEKAGIESQQGHIPTERIYARAGEDYEEFACIVPERSELIIKEGVGQHSVAQERDKGLSQILVLLAAHLSGSPGIS